MEDGGEMVVDEEAAPGLATCERAVGGVRSHPLQLSSTVKGGWTGGLHSPAVDVVE